MKNFIKSCVALTLLSYPAASLITKVRPSFWKLPLALKIINIFRSPGSQCPNLYRLLPWTASLPPWHNAQCFASTQTLTMVKWYTYEWYIKVKVCWIRRASNMYCPLLGSFRPSLRPWKRWLFSTSRKPAHLGLPRHRFVSKGSV